MVTLRESAEDVPEAHDGFRKRNRLLTERRKNRPAMQERPV